MYTREQIQADAARAGVKLDDAEISHLLAFRHAFIQVAAGSVIKRLYYGFANEWARGFLRGGPVRS